MTYRNSAALLVFTLFTFVGQYSETQAICSGLVTPPAPRRISRIQEILLRLKGSITLQGGAKIRVREVFRVGAKPNEAITQINSDVQSVLSSLRVQKWIGRIRGTLRTNNPEAIQKVYEALVSNKVYTKWQRDLPKAELKLNEALSTLGQEIAQVTTWYQNLSTKPNPGYFDRAMTIYLRAKLRQLEDLIELTKDTLHLFAKMKSGEVVLKPGESAPEPAATTSDSQTDTLFWWYLYMQLYGNHNFSLATRYAIDPQHESGHGAVYNYERNKTQIIENDADRDGIKDHKDGSIDTNGNLLNESKRDGPAEDPFVESNQRDSDGDGVRDNIDWNVGTHEVTESIASDANSSYDPAPAYDPPTYDPPSYDPSPSFDGG